MAWACLHTSACWPNEFLSAICFRKTLPLKNTQTRTYTNDASYRPGLVYCTWLATYHESDETLRSIEAGSLPLQGSWKMFWDVRAAGKASCSIELIFLYDTGAKVCWPQ